MSVHECPSCSCEGEPYRTNARVEDPPSTTKKPSLKKRLAEKPHVLIGLSALACSLPFIAVLLWTTALVGHAVAHSSHWYGDLCWGFCIFVAVGLVSIFVLGGCEELGRKIAASWKREP